jgi:SAM-dependent methyltransferase
MAADLEFTGERFLPGVAGEIAHEHWHRYAFARRFVTGRRVLDVACGEGYGSALLADVAQSVVGVDIAHGAIAHARESYASRPNLRFVEASAASLPLADGVVDAVVSFETIEHLARDDQPRMLAEIARVLSPRGVLVLSAPNPAEYSQARGYRNPFHEHEPARDEMETLLGRAFAAQRWFAQRRYFGSSIWSEDPGGGFEAWEEAGGRVDAASRPPAMYFIVVAAKDAAALPSEVAALSLFSDRAEGELARLDAQGAEVLRLDNLAKERDAAIARAADHVRHLEELVAYRERLVEERDAQLAAVNAALAKALNERDAMQKQRDNVSAARASEAASARQVADALNDEVQRLGRAIAAQERIIAYRQSARWWFVLPWMRVKLWWQRTIGT